MRIKEHQMGNIPINADKRQDSSFTPGQRFNPYRLFVGSFLPNWLMRRTEISQGAKLCYARLSQYAGEHGSAYPSQPVLAQELGVKVRQVRSYLNELETVDLIESEQLGLSQTNRYYFLVHPWMLETGSQQRPALNCRSRRHYTAGQGGRRLPVHAAGYCRQR